jgi:hypothetical protein
MVPRTNGNLGWAMEYAGAWRRRRSTIDFGKIGFWTQSDSVDGLSCFFDLGGHPANSYWFAHEVLRAMVHSTLFGEPWCS